jgi:hypothetical protein
VAAADAPIWRAAVCTSSDSDEPYVDLSSPPERGEFVQQLNSHTRRDEHGNPLEIDIDVTQFKPMNTARQVSKMLPSSSSCR